MTALHIAVDLAYYKTVEALLEANANPNVTDHEDETPLHVAVKKVPRLYINPPPPRLRVALYLRYINFIIIERHTTAAASGSQVHRHPLRIPARVLNKPD